MNKQDLDFILWSTSSIRFSQSARYNKLESTIYFSLLVISIYLTVISLISPTLFPEKQKIINLFIISGSFIITILVVLLKSAKLSDRSRLQHDCGRKIRTLLYDLKSKDNASEYKNIFSNYNNILNSYENHSKIDYLYFWYDSFNKVHEDKKRNAPSRFMRNIVAPLFYTVFPNAAILISVFSPPILFLYFLF